MPRWVFIKSDQEPKPVLVDFENPLAVDLLNKQARQATRLTVSEMRPSPDELWLRDDRGTFTCELRTSFSLRAISNSSTGAEACVSCSGVPVEEEV